MLPWLVRRNLNHDRYTFGVSPWKSASWLAKSMSERKQQAPQCWLDIRPFDEFKKSHFKNAMNIEWGSNFQKKLFMLPNKNLGFGLVAANQEIADQATVAIKSRGWKKIEPIVVFGEKGSEDIELSTAEKFIPNFLFQPSPFLSSCINAIETDLLQNIPGSSPEYDFRCCDLGCGSGRNSVWLATRGSSVRARFPLVNEDSSVDDVKADGIVSPIEWSWKVDGVDCFPNMLENLLELSLDLNCSDRISAHCCKITGEGNIKEIAYKGKHAEKVTTSAGFESEQYDLLLCIRFLERAFFSQMVKMLRPGGYVLISTFSKSGGGEGPKNVNRVVKDDELSSFFGEHGFDVLIDSEDSSEDGRAMRSFLARAPRT
jgi:2-polyprenyl-3-methyl-5-hydroxy-6-metoxy-1,4-benzoquinol methylase